MTPVPAEWISANSPVRFAASGFCGQIGREYVAVLYQPEVEKPSDIDGLVYVSLGTNWRERPVRELRSAGLDFSLDRVWRDL